MAITAWRSAFAALALGLFFREKILKTNRKTWLAAAVHAATMLLFVTSIKLTTAANAIFLQFTAPIYVLLAEPFLFRTKMKRLDALAVAACLGGMSLFFIDGGGEKTSLPNAFLGNLLALASGLTLAAFMLFQRLNDDEAANFSTIFWSNFLVVAGSFALGAAPSIFWPSENDLWRLAFLGIFQIALATALFVWGLRRTLAIEASLLAFVEPILNPVWVWLGFGERPSNWALLGGAVIVAALFLRAYFSGKPSKKAQKRSF